MFLALAEMRRSLGRFTLLTAAVGLLVLLLLFFQTTGQALLSGATGAFEQAEAEVWVYAEDARRNPVASVVDPAVVDEVADVPGVASADTVTFTVFEVDGEPTSIVAADPGSAARPPLDEGTAATADGEAVAGVSTFVDGSGADTVELPGVTLTVTGSAEGATFQVLPTYFASRADVATALEARAGAPVPLPASAVAVRVADDAAPADVAAAITRAVPGVEAVDRAAAIAGVPGAETIGRSFSLLDVLLFIVVGIVTAVFFLILTVQKRDSLVLLRAVGAERRDVVRPVLVQVVAVVGGAVALGTLAAVGLLSAASDVFGSSLAADTVVRSSGTVLLLGLVAGLLSLRRVLRTEPVEAVSQGGL